MTKFKIEQKQFDEIRGEMQNAMFKIGEKCGYDYDVIEKTINDMSVIDALYEMYEINEHRINTDDFYKYLIKLNDYEMNGVVENFAVIEQQMIDNGEITETE